MDGFHDPAARLKRSREDTVREISRLRVQLQEKIEPASATDDDAADAAADIYERGKTLSLLSSLNAKLHSLDRAIEMVAAGTYGVCEMCGDSIPVERLEIVPEATLCVQCASTVERGANRRSGFKPYRRRRAEIPDEPQD